MPKIGFYFSKQIGYHHFAFARGCLIPRVVYRRDLSRLYLSTDFDLVIFSKILYKYLFSFNSLTNSLILSEDKAIPRFCLDVCNL